MRHLSDLSRDNEETELESDTDDDTLSTPGESSDDEPNVSFLSSRYKDRISALGSDSF